MSKTSSQGSSTGSKGSTGGGSKLTLELDEKINKSVEALQWAEQKFGKSPTVAVGRAVAKGSTGMNQVLGWMKGDKNLTTYGGVVPLHLQVSARVHHIFFLHPSLDPACSLTKLLPGSESNEAVMVGNMASMIESEQRRLSRDGVVGDHFAGSRNVKQCKHEQNDLKGVRRILVNSSGTDEDTSSMKKIENSINSKVQKLMSTSFNNPAERSKKLNFKDDFDSKKDKIDKYSHMLFSDSNANEDYLNHLPHSKGWKHAKMVLQNSALAKIGRYLPETSVRVPNAAVSFEIKNDKRRTKTTQPFVVESPHVIWGEGRDILLHKVAEDNCALVDLRPLEFLKNEDLALAQNKESLIFVGSTLWIQYPPVTKSVKYKTAPEIFAEALQQVDEIETKAANAVMTGAIVVTDHMSKSRFKNAASKVLNIKNQDRQAQAQSISLRQHLKARSEKKKSKRFSISSFPFRSKKNFKSGSNRLDDSVDTSKISLKEQRSKAQQEMKSSVQSLPARLPTSTIRKSRHTKSVNKSRVTFADMQEKPKPQERASLIDYLSRSLLSSQPFEQDTETILPPAPVSTKETTDEQRTIENLNIVSTSFKIQKMLDEHRRNKISGRLSFFLKIINANSSTIPTGDDRLPIGVTIPSPTDNEVNDKIDETASQSTVEDMNKSITKSKIDKMVQESSSATTKSEVNKNGFVSHSTIDDMNKSTKNKIDQMVRESFVSSLNEDDNDDFFDAVSEDESNNLPVTNNVRSSNVKNDTIPAKTRDSDVRSFNVETSEEESPDQPKAFTSSTRTAPTSNVAESPEDEDSILISTPSIASQSLSLGTTGTKHIPMPYILVLDEILEFRIVDFPDGNVIASFPVSVAAILNKRTMEERVNDPHYPSELTVTLVQEPSISKSLWGVEVTVTFRCCEVKQKNLIKIEAPSLDTTGNKKNTENKLNELSNSLKKAGKSQKEIDEILEKSESKIIEEDERLEVAILEQQEFEDDGDVERQLFWDRNVKEEQARMNAEITFDKNVSLDCKHNNTQNGTSDFNRPD